MRHQYHDLNPSDFERLVVAICFELLGAGTQPFSSGPDGGRDARYEGTAVAFPSTANPYTGRFIAQSKHTEDPCAKFSDPDFAGDGSSSILTKEIPRVSELVLGGDLDHYLLFSNRRLGGAVDAEIRARVRDQSGAKTVELFGVERIDVLLKKFPDIERTADIKALSAPLLVTPDDIAEVVVHLDHERSTFASARQNVDSVKRTSLEVKNRLNGLSAEFDKVIRTGYMKDFGIIKKFLANPSNADLAGRYDDAAAEFHEQILAHRASSDTFDQVLVRIQMLLFQRDPDLARRKRLTKLVLYYMYWNCDIGVSGT